MRLDVKEFWIGALEQHDPPPGARLREVNRGRLRYSSWGILCEKWRRIHPHRGWWTPAPYSDPHCWYLRVGESTKSGVLYLTKPPPEVLIWADIRAEPWVSSLNGVDVARILRSL